LNLLLSGIIPRFEERKGMDLSERAGDPAVVMDFFHPYPKSGHGLQAEKNRAKRTALARSESSMQKRKERPEGIGPRKSEFNA
jgi:hypothetical protein